MGPYSSHLAGGILQIAPSTNCTTGNNHRTTKRYRHTYQYFLNFQKILKLLLQIKSRVRDLLCSYLKNFTRLTTNQFSSALIITASDLSACLPRRLIPLTVS